MRRGSLAMLGLLLALRAAHADDAPAKSSYDLIVDRIEHEPASIGGTRLRVTVSALTLQGQPIDLSDPKSIKTYVGNSELKAPYALGTFAGTKEALALVVVVESSVDYTEVMPAIAETLDGTLLAALDDDVTQVAVLPFGEAIGNGKLGTMKSARGKVTALAADGGTGDPALLETIERGLSLLKRAKTNPEGKPLRKLIVVISDGRDRNSDKERVTRLGTRAGKEGVRIDTFAYSPSDTRRPLLALGELSKRSRGKLRWLQRGKSDSWAAAFEQLRDEILKQYVLTYFVPTEDDPGGKKLKIVTVGRVEATSNEMKVPEPTCNGETCAGYCAGSVCAVPKQATGRGVLGWVLMIGLIGLGTIVLLGFIGFLLSKRQKGPKPPKPIVPGMPVPGMPVPGAAPQAPVQAAAPAAQAYVAGPTLMFLTGPRTGERLPVRNGFMIGKAPGSDLQIEDGFTSGQHAQIGVDHFGNCRLYDRNSTNGTFVNGVRVTEYALEHGVSIRIGQTDLRFLSQ